MFRELADTRDYFAQQDDNFDQSYVVNFIDVKFRVYADLHNDRHRIENGKTFDSYYTITTMLFKIYSTHNLQIG